MNNGKGFTLIELLVTIAIIGILAVIAIPAYIGQQKNATRTDAYSNLENLRLLEEQYFAENGVYTPSIASYKGTAAADGGIEDTLKGFRPGEEVSLNFTYAITQNVDIDGNAQTPCFRATATGKAGRRVEGDSFSIDCNNTKNF
jgi:type IV pilus assembly protein PilE